MIQVEPTPIAPVSLPVNENGRADQDSESDDSLPALIPKPVVHDEQPVLRLPPPPPDDDVPSQSAEGVTVNEVPSPVSMPLKVESVRSNLQSQQTASEHKQQEPSVTPIIVHAAKTHGAMR